MSEAAHPAPGEDPAGTTAPETAGGSEEAADAAALRARAAELEKRVGELESLWRQALADSDNMRKRHVRETERLRDAERAEVARRWLPVLDDLERALRHAESDPDTIVDGVRSVRDEAIGVLARLGFPRRDDLGARFDPALHDAMGSVPATGAAPGTVVEVVHPAYGDGDHQLRAALVIVAGSG